MTPTRDKERMTAMAKAVAATDPILREAMAPGARMEVQIRRGTDTGIEGWAHVVPADDSHVRSSIETERALMLLAEEFEDLAGGRLTVSRIYLHETVYAPRSATLAAGAVARGANEDQRSALRDLGELLRRRGHADLADRLMVRNGSDAAAEKS